MNRWFVLIVVLAGAAGLTAKFFKLIGELRLPEKDPRARIYEQLGQLEEAERRRFRIPPTEP